MAKTPAASARKKTPARGSGSGGRGSHSKAPRSGGAKSPRCTTSETLLHEDSAHQFYSDVDFIPRRDKFMKSDPLSGPTFNQDADCNWTVTIGDLACIEAAADDDGGEHPNGACGVTAPFSVRWRPCQILSLFRERDKSTESKLSKKKHWGPLKAEVRWFYRHADLDDRNRKYEKTKRGSGEEVFESGHVSVADASLLLGKLVLKRSPGEEGKYDFLPYPVPTVEKHCHRYYFRKDQDVFEAFDGENMVRRGMECSNLLKNEKVAAAVYRYLELSPPKGNVEGDGRIALPPPSKSVKLHGEVAAYYSSCTLEHSWSELKHGNLLCPLDKRGAFPKWQLCVGDMVAVHMGDSTPASGADAIAGRDKWYPYRVKWSHGQVTAIFRSFDKMSDVPKEESTVDPSELICEIRWFPRPSEALSEGIRLLGKQLKQPVRDRLKQVAGDSERTCDVIIEGKQATTVVANCLLGPVLVEDKPGSNEERRISRFLPHNRRVVSDQVRCNAKGIPHEAKRMESVDFDPSLRVQRGISASKRFTGDAQRASVLKAALHCRRERAERLQHPEDAAGESNDGDVAAESLSAESPQKKRQLFADYYEEEIAESKKRRLSEGPTQRNDTLPATANQAYPLPPSPAKKEGKQQPTATCRSAPFHVDVSALKSFYEEVEIAPQTESYDDRFAAGAGAKPWKVKLGDTVTVEVEPANAKESSVKFPFVVPWGPVEVVSIYRVHRTKESCARLREQLSRKGDEGNKFSPDDNSGDVMIEVRWFYRPWEIPGASKKKSEPMDDGELVEVFETDKIDNCSADSILSPVRLHDEKRPSDAPHAVMGMPCIHYHCGRLWSIHRRSFIPSGSLANRVSRGRMYSEYKSVLDMRQSVLSIEDAATSNQKGDQTWRGAFQTAIQQLSLAAAAEDAQEKGMVLACRKKERDQIKSFLTKAITGLVQTSHSQGHDEDETSKNLKSSMFIAGPPGTGKTASVRSVVAELQKEQHGGKLPEFKFIALNGMELRHPFDAYIKFWEALSGTRKESLKAGDAAYELEHYFCGDQMEESEDESSEDGSEEEEEDEGGEEEDDVVEDYEEGMQQAEMSERPVTVLMLDEIDKLVTKKETLIYNLFDWPLRATTARLVVIGIANTINLPEKMSMRVQSRIGGNRCYFKSYDVKDTMTILKSRLGMLDGTHSYSVFEEDAIKFASRKAANLSGDIRKAFRMCKVAAEMVYEDLISGKRPMPRGNRPIVKISDVQKGSRDVFTSIVIKAVSHSTSYEALFMISLGALKRTREDGSFTIKEMLTKIESIANASGEPRYMNARLSFADVLGLASRLGAAGIIQVTTHDSSPFPWISTHLETYEINGAFRDTKHSKLSEKHLANQRLF